MRGEGEGRSREEEGKVDMRGGGRRKWEEAGGRGVGGSPILSLSKKKTERRAWYHSQ